ncbi:MAG: sensor histidine kinase [Rhodocyclales bacterium]|nr:sensor histidine kinase [Rhodocyclales bacterium]
MDPHTTPSSRESRAPSFALIIIGVATLIGLIWIANRSIGNPTASSINALSTLLIISLLAVAGWSLLTAREQHHRIAVIAGERDRIFALSLDLLCVLSMGGTVKRANPAFLNVLGQRPDHLPDKSILDLIHPDDVHVVSFALDTLIEGKPSNFEVRCRCGDGSYKWLSWSANPVREDNLIFAVAHDVSNRRATEDALRVETAFRKAMEESVSTGLRAIDLRGRTIYVNHAFCEMTGRTAEELVGSEPPFVYWPENEFTTNWQNLALCLSGKAPKEGFEVRIQRANGSTLDVRLHESPLVDANGIQTGWMSALTDITESRRVRGDLEAAYERFTAVLDGLDAAVYVVDAANGEVLYANRAFLRRDDSNALAGHDGLAIPRPEMGDYLLDPRNLDPGQLPRELFDGELQHPVTGHWFHVRERATLWVDGRVVRLAVATDISDLKHVEELNREQEARLARTSRLITMGEMASTLAHELNQPLSAIANYAKGCVNRLKSGDYRFDDILAAMEKANAQAARAGHIVRRVRDFVRKSEPKRADVELTEIAEDALGIAEIEAQRLGIKIELHLEEGLPSVYADRIMIEQVLLNLVKNAAEAELGQPRERCVVVVAARQVDDLIEVSVTDLGHGIGEADRERLFSAFFSTKAEGMGMGLNICRSIIEFHNGRLWVDPNPMGGSIFKFTLPLENSLEPQSVAVP